MISVLIILLFLQGGGDGDGDGGLNSSLVCCVIDGEETEERVFILTPWFMIEFGGRSIIRV